jgi:hypothetical protein
MGDTHSKGIKHKKKENNRVSLAKTYNVEAIRLDDDGDNPEKVELELEHIEDLGELERYSCCHSVVTLNIFILTF